MKRTNGCFRWGFPFVLNVLALVEALCPNPTSIYPCYCSDQRSVIICENVTYEEDLTSVMTAAQKQRGVVGVELQSVSLRYIPEEAFEGTQLKLLSITNSSVLSLSETGHAFKGLEDSLIALRVKNCPFVNDWDWSQLERLRKLQVLEISDSELLELTDEFARIHRLPLSDVSFRNNELETLPYQAFASFRDLKRLNLDKNALKSITRSTLPTPAKKLQSLSLSQNQIAVLHSNMFSEMPALKYLYLSENPIQLLDEQTFKPVWKNFRIFALQDSSLLCDCRISWLTKMNHKYRLTHGACSSPLRLKGTKIVELKARDVPC